MQFGLHLGGEVVMLVFVVLYWAVIVGAVVKLIGWIVARRTKELRQRVALLEHKVTEIEAAADDDSLDGAE